MKAMAMFVILAGLFMGACSSATNNARAKDSLDDLLQVDVGTDQLQSLRARAGMDDGKSTPLFELGDRSVPTAGPLKSHRSVSDRLGRPATMIAGQKHEDEVEIRSAPGQVTYFDFDADP